MLAMTLACSAPSMGAEVAVHGFGTVGAAWLDKPADWSFVREMNQRTNDARWRADVDSVVGVQVNYAPSRSLELVGQATASRMDHDAGAKDFIELAFAAWRPDPAWTVRLGRVNLDAYLYSDHRDVGFTYPYIRPPVEYYSRMPTSLDGADIGRNWMRGDAHWQAKLYAGRTSAGLGDGRLKLAPLYGITLSRESYGLLLRLSAVHARTRDAIPAMRPLLEGLQQMQALPVSEVADEAARLEASLMTGGMRTNYLAAGAAYDRNSWLFTAELNRAKVDADNSSFTTGYLSIGRRFGPVTAFVIESAALRDAKPREAPDWITPLTPFDPLLAQQAQAIAEGATQAFNHGAGHQHTTSAGLRWDVTSRVALKAQWDHVRTRRDGHGLWRNGDGRPARSDIVAVAADFVF